MPAREKGIQPQLTQPVAPVVETLGFVMGTYPRYSMMTRAELATPHNKVGCPFPLLCRAALPDSWPPHLAELLLMPPTPPPRSLGLGAPALSLAEGHTVWDALSLVSLHLSFLPTSFVCCHVPPFIWLLPSTQRPLLLAGRSPSPFPYHSKSPLLPTAGCPAPAHITPIPLPEMTTEALPRLWSSTPPAIIEKQLKWPLLWCHSGPLHISHLYGCG